MRVPGMRTFGRARCLAKRAKARQELFHNFLKKSYQDSMLQGNV
jgi:hypothetical protein